MKRQLKHEAWLALAALVVVALLGACVQCPSCPPCPPEESPTREEERNRTNELWVNSYPAGAEVYLVPGTVSGQYPKLDNVMQTKNLLGTAPLTHELSAGTYYVVTSFTPDLFTAAGYDLPTYSDPSFDDAFPFDGNPSQSMSFTNGEEIERFSKIYRLIKDPRSPEVLISIALPLPENQRGQPKPVLYPTLATVEALPVSYIFDDAIVRRAIEDDLRDNNLTAMVGPSMVDEMVEVLLRVGKVKLGTSHVDLIIQINGTDTSSFSITVYR